MAKIFTITEGLENLGALKSGGQGSVFKGRRIGEVITAVKILPTPIFDVNGNDKNYLDFKNEVQKLQRVNEKPNPYVVTILSHGVTESGSFPFIEMEYIEGPDLDGKLHPPHDPVFPVKECIKVAEHLSHALAHCHHLDVKHGDVKSNNVKFNVRTGNYMLLDFGLSLLSDEARRTSMRRAGSVEFMAPEQGDGALLFQSDIYSFGVVIFELLAGRVPFPLADHTDTAHHSVVLAQKEAPVPDLLSLRNEHMPGGWSEDRRLQEATVPQWLQEVVYRCLEKLPEKRFANGKELYDYICSHIVTTVGMDNPAANLSALKKENARLRAQLAALQKTSLPGQVGKSGANKIKQRFGSGLRQLPKKTIWALSIVIIILLFLLVWSNSNKHSPLSLSATQVVQPKGIIGQYRVTSPRAYFYENAAESGRQGAYLIPSNDVIPAIKETDGFIYTEFVSNDNKEVSGWLKKQDLIAIDALVKRAGKPAGVRLNTPDMDAQLEEARKALANGEEKRALNIYKYLSEQRVPEAMYYYGKLGLQNRNDQVNCKEAYSLVYNASNKGYTPAKAIVGFLFAFGNDSQTLHAELLTRCSYRENRLKGAQLLMAATLEGDTTAKRWLKKLNLQQPSFNPQ